MRDAAIVGVGQTRLGRRDDVSTAELAEEAVVAALESCDLSVEDIDAVFFGSAPDALIGVNMPDQFLVGSIAATGKPMMRISTGGSTGSSAAIGAYYAVASSMEDVVLTVAVERANESDAVQMLMNTNFDPIYKKDFGLNAISCYALATVDHMLRYGTTEEQLAKISVANHLNALRNPHAHLKKAITVEDVMNSRVLCWPVKLFDTCPRSDGAAAVVIAGADRAPKLTPRPAWFHGVRSVTDGYFLGEREVFKPEDAPRPSRAGVLSRCRHR